MATNVNRHKIAGAHKHNKRAHLYTEQSRASARTRTYVYTHIHTHTSTVGKYSKTDEGALRAEREDWLLSRVWSHRASSRRSFPFQHAELPPLRARNVPAAARVVLFPSPRRLFTRYTFNTYLTLGRSRPSPLSLPPTRRPGPWLMFVTTGRECRPPC